MVLQLEKKQVKNVRHRNNTARAKMSLTKTNEQERILRYIPFNVRSDISRGKDKEKKRNMLREWLKRNEPQFSLLFNLNYDYQIDKFINTMELTVKTYRTPTELEKSGIIDEKKRKRVIIKPSISAMRKGKGYTRTPSIKFENKKTLVTFIRVRLGQKKTMRQITTEYNQVATRKGWRIRTIKSLQNVKYREKIVS